MSPVRDNLVGMNDELARTAKIMGISRAELVRRLRKWSDDDWAAEEARLNVPAGDRPQRSPDAGHG